MNAPLDTFGKRTPYGSAPERLDALHDRIRRQTILRGRAPRRMTLRMACTAAAAAAVVAVGAVALVRLHGRTSRPVPDIDALLRSASAETLRQAAAENYDDILYDQQL